MPRVPTNSLQRALLLLEFIGKTPGGLTNLEISREFQIPRSTCSYILSRLEREGYLARETESGRYKIGLKMVVLGRSALREVGFRSVTEPILYRLAMNTGLAANLGVLQRNRVVVLDRVEGPPFVRDAIQEAGELPGSKSSHRKVTSEYLRREQRDIGTELPVYSTAMGRALLAHLPHPQLAEFLERWPPFKKGSRTSIGKPELITELEKVREQGYSMMEIEPHNESCALAALIFDATGTARAAVSVSCRRHLAVWNDERSLSELVKDAALEISRRLYPVSAGPGQLDGLKEVAPTLR